MTIIQSLLLALLQGTTELFPVSSLGHAVLLPRLLAWGVDQKALQFLPFLVVLHLGTATALLIYFGREWLGYVRALVGKGKNVKGERRVFGLICVATLPAVLIGLAFEHILRGFFAAPELAAIFLIINGGILFVGERIKHDGRKKLEELSWGKALLIGAAQALALIPGISRSGATMVGGIMAGLTHKDAAKFSFLMATPVIAGAGVVEIPKLIKLRETLSFDLGTMVIAGVVAGVTAYLSTWILMRYFKYNEMEALNPFAYYCWAAGLLSLLILLI